MTFNQSDLSIEINDFSVGYCRSNICSEVLNANLSVMKETFSENCILEIYSKMLQTHNSILFMPSLVCVLHPSLCPKGKSLS